MMTLAKFKALDNLLNMGVPMDDALRGIKHVMGLTADEEEAFRTFYAMLDEAESEEYTDEDFAAMELDYNEWRLRKMIDALLN